MLKAVIKDPSADVCRHRLWIHNQTDRLLYCAPCTYINGQLQCRCRWKKYMNTTNHAHDVLRKRANLTTCDSPEILHYMLLLLFQACRLPRSHRCSLLSALFAQRFLKQEVVPIAMRMGMGCLQRLAPCMQCVKQALLQMVGVGHQVCVAGQHIQFRSPQMVIVSMCMAFGLDLTEQRFRLVPCHQRPQMCWHVKTTNLC